MSKKDSKFQAIFTTDEEESEVASPEPTRPALSTSKKKHGRPRGKRSDPDFEQVTAYIHKDVHQDVKVALLQNGCGQDFSELVDTLLVKWLRTQKSKSSKT